MPTNEEVKVPEVPPESAGPSSATSPSHLASRPPQDSGNGNGGPYLLPYRNSRYKEKFHALREKYDRVTAKQAEYHRDLEIATAKIKKLQAENDLLLDAMHLAAKQDPESFGLTEAPYYADLPMESSASAAPARPVSLNGHHAPPPPHSSSNGNGIGTRSGSSGTPGFGPPVQTQTNGTHPLPPPIELSRRPSMEFIAHDMNGRAP